MTYIGVSAKCYRLLDVKITYKITYYVTNNINVYVSSHFIFI